MTTGEDLRLYDGDWVVACNQGEGNQLTVDEVRAGTRFPDAVARTARPIELHDTRQGYVVQGRRYKGLLTTVMHRIDGDGRVVEYREFLGGLTTGLTAD